MREIVLVIIAVALLPAYVASDATAAEGEARRQVRVLRAAEPGEGHALKIVPEVADDAGVAAGRVGMPYMQAFSAVGGHGYGFIWDHGLLPAGLFMRFDPMRKGRVFIAGEPEEAGEFEITVTVTDVKDTSVTAEHSFLLEVEPLGLH